MTLGWCYVELDEWATAIDVLERALACSPDAYETSILTGFLGYAYLEKGDVAEAIPTLGHAVQMTNQYRSRQVQSWFNVYLGEAYRVDGHIEKARDSTLQGLQLAQDAKHPWGAALAQRTLEIMRGSGLALASWTSGNKPRIISSVRLR